MANIIRQIVSDDGYGAQTIKMIVRSNERGPQGEQGQTGPAATIDAGSVYMVSPTDPARVINSGTQSEAVFDFYIPKGTKGDPGKDGAIQYTAGMGINITSDNVIEATGQATAAWGGIVGTLSNQTDLQNALNAKQGVLTAGTNINITGSTISATDTTYSDFTGTDGVTAGSAGLVPGPTTSDTGKFLNANGQWEAQTAPNNGTLTITDNGATVGTFTANQATNETVNLAVPVITMTTTDPGEGSPLAANNFIAVYASQEL